MGRRAAAVWLVLFLVYAATLGLDAFPGSDYGGDEPHYLLAAASIVEDGDVDLLDEYRTRAFADFYPLTLDAHGSPSGGRLLELHGVGFPALIAPAFAAGGPQAVELMLAAIAALAGALAYLLALRVTPDPWALGAALAVGLSPPLLAYGSAVYPELAAGAALAGAALLAQRLATRPSRASTVACFVLLAVMPWLGVKYVPAALVVGFFAVRALWGAGRRMRAVGGLEIAAVSAFLYVSLNQALYGGLTPYAVGVTTEADSAGDYANRAFRLAALLVDRDYGLLRWAPVLALAAVGTWLLWHARREHLTSALPTRHDAETTASLCAAAIGAQLLVATFLAPTMFGFFFPGRHLVAALPLAVPLVAWGLRRLPRLGAALATIGVTASVWLYADLRLGDGSLVSGLPDAPWGPLEAAFPYFGESPLPYALAAVGGAGLLLAVGLDWLRWRRTVGTAHAGAS